MVASRGHEDKARGDGIGSPLVPTSSVSISPDIESLIRETICDYGDECTQRLATTSSSGTDLAF